MARDTTDDTPVTNTAELVAYLASGAKPEDQFRLGTEHEKFGFFRAGKGPVPYFGKAGIAAILDQMGARLGWDPIMDQGHVIGLASPVGQGAISLEPGGQFELSGAPLRTLHETAEETRAHIRLANEIAGPMGIGFVGLGGSPKWSFAETPRMPKSRYDIMSRYMPKVGSQGLDMMYRTCTIQVNVDFASEADMRRKMQVSLKLQSLATALFAASPFTEGRPNGLKSWRGNIWRDTDRNRTGLLPFAFSPDYGFEHYVEWALDVPMYFIVRDGRYHDCTHVTFRRFMAGALKGEVKDWQPTLGDWTNHLSTLFPDVRLKRFLEMRGADCGTPDRIPALSAFWVGLLYDASALSDAFDLTAGWTFEDVSALRDSVPKLALEASIAGRPLGEVAREVVAISRKGLANRALLDAEGRDETIHLAPVEAVAESGRTLADEMLDRFHGVWNSDVDRLFDDYAY